MTHPIRRSSLNVATLAMIWRRVGVLVALALVVAVASFLSHRFLTVPNLLNVLRQVAIVGILALGMTFVILTRGIDLSVGSILGISVVLYAGLLENHGMLVAIPLGVCAAMAAGLVNGVGISYAGIPPFIMTLGMLSFARGLAFIYTGGTPIPILNESFYDLGNGYLLGIPIPSLILISVLVASGIVLSLTPFGREGPRAVTRRKSQRHHQKGRGDRFRQRPSGEIDEFEPGRRHQPGHQGMGPAGSLPHAVDRHDPQERERGHAEVGSVERAVPVR